MKQAVTSKPKWWQFVFPVHFRMSFRFHSPCGYYGRVRFFHANSSQEADEVNTFQFLVMFGSNFQTTSSESMISMVIANIGQVLFINGSRCGRESSLIRVK